MNHYQIQISPKTEQEHKDVKTALFEWRSKWSDELGLSFVPSVRDHTRIEGKWLKSKRVIVQAPLHAINDLPKQVGVQEIDLSPVWNIVAQIKDGNYESKGKIVHGSKHFKPGELIYPHSVHSGDGYERTYLTGRHKETEMIITLLSGLTRLENWRIETVSNPIIVYELNSRIGWQDRHGSDQEMAKGICKRMNAMNQSQANLIQYSCGNARALQHRSCHPSHAAISTTCLPSACCGAYLRSPKRSVGIAEK